MGGHNNVEKHCKDYLKRINNFIDCVDEWVRLKNERIAE